MSATTPASWSTLPPELRELALRVCTSKQLDVLKLWAGGASNRKGARMLRMDQSTFREHLEKAFARLVAAAEREGLSFFK